MKKKLEADLISIAHRILKLKNSDPTSVRHARASSKSVVAPALALPCGHAHDDDDDPVRGGPVRPARRAAVSEVPLVQNDRAIWIRRSARVEADT